MVSVTLLVACSAPDDPRSVGGEAPPEVTVDLTPAEIVLPTGDSADVVDEMAGFSFVDEWVAGLPRPTRADLRFLVARDIDLLVSLTPDPIPADELASVGLEGLHLPIEDFAAPTLDQQRVFVDAVGARVAVGERVAVHCTAGLGRTGTMLATWFVAVGLGPDEAIASVRASRPGSIETVEQERSVWVYASSVAP